jgi:hypothetical protein
MNRWLGLGIVVVLLIVAWIGFFQPQVFPGNLDVPRLVYLLMALMLVSGAGWGFARTRMQPGAAVAGIVFWAALIVVTVMVYSWFN